MNKHRLYNVNFKVPLLYSLKVLVLWFSGYFISFIDFIIITASFIIIITNIYNHYLSLSFLDHHTSTQRLKTKVLIGLMTCREILHKMKILIGLMAYLIRLILLWSMLLWDLKLISSITPFRWLAMRLVLVFSLFGTDVSNLMREFD